MIPIIMNLSPDAPSGFAAPFIPLLAEAHQHVIKITTHLRPFLLLCF